MKTFNFRGFYVTITGIHGSYGYVASNGKHKMVDPDPEYSYTSYSTTKDAEEAARQAIFMYEVMEMFVALTGEERAFIAYVMKQVYDKEWIVNPQSNIIQQILKTGGIRRR